MSRTKQEVSLLEYVIAYLQEEDQSMVSAEIYAAQDVKQLVNDAIDAYVGGAR